MVKYLYKWKYDEKTRSVIFTNMHGTFARPAHGAKERFLILNVVNFLLGSGRSSARTQRAKFVKQSLIHMENSKCL